MEDRILFGLESPTERTRQHADFMASMTAQYLTALANKGC